MSPPTTPPLRVVQDDLLGETAGDDVAGAVGDLHGEVVRVGGVRVGVVVPPFQDELAGSEHRLIDSVGLSEGVLARPSTCPPRSSSPDYLAIALPTMFAEMERIHMMERAASARAAKEARGLPTGRPAKLNAGAVGEFAHRVTAVRHVLDDRRGQPVSTEYGPRCCLGSPAPITHRHRRSAYRPGR